MKFFAVMIVVLAFTTPILATTYGEFESALNMVEASGRKTGVPRGDNGLARGPLQIHQDYFIDSRVKGDWTQCEQWEFSRQVMRGYFSRYGKTALNRDDWRSLALLHHYGPNWRARQSDPHGYWGKVSKHLKE